MSKEIKSSTDEEMEAEIDEIFKDYPHGQNPIKVALIFVGMAFALGIALYCAAQSL